MARFLLGALAAAAMVIAPPQEPAGLAKYVVRKIPTNLAVVSFIETLRALKERGNPASAVFQSYAVLYDPAKPYDSLIGFDHEPYQQPTDEDFLSQLRNMTEALRATYYTRVVAACELLEKAGFLVLPQPSTLAHVGAPFGEVIIVPRLSSIMLKSAALTSGNVMLLRMRRTMQRAAKGPLAPFTNIFGVATFFLDVEFWIGARKTAKAFKGIQSHRMYRGPQAAFAFAPADAAAPFSQSEREEWKKMARRKSMYASLLKYVEAGAPAKEGFQGLSDVLKAHVGLRIASIGSFGVTLSH